MKAWTSPSDRNSHTVLSRRRPVITHHCGTAEEANRLAHILNQQSDELAGDIADVVRASRGDSSKNWWVRLWERHSGGAVVPEALLRLSDDDQIVDDLARGWYERVRNKGREISPHWDDIGDQQGYFRELARESLREGKSE